MRTKCAILLLTLSWSYLSYGQIKIEDIKIDTSITGFHLAANLNGAVVYTPTGSTGNEEGGSKQSGFSFFILPNASFATAVEQIEFPLFMSRKSDYVQSNVVRRDTTINGKKGYYISLIQTHRETDVKNHLFHAFYLKGNSAVVFVSSDLDNGKYQDGFRKTFFVSSKN